MCCYLSGRAVKLDYVTFCKYNQTKPMFPSPRLSSGLLPLHGEGGGGGGLIFTLLDVKYGR